jgi:glucose/arabinose dehydrogenase
MTGRIFFESAEISVSEASGIVNVPIVRTGDLSGRVVIEFSTSAGTAAAGQDYVSRSGTAILEPGQSRVLVPVAITNDTTGEPTETFPVSIINVSSGTLSAPRTTQVSILDDETPANDPTDPPFVSDYDVTLNDKFKGFATPIAIEFSPVAGNKTMFVAEKGGFIKTVNIDTGATAVMLDISSKVNSAGDRGLLDIAISPDLQKNPYLYAFYTVDPADTAGKTGNAGPDGGGNRFSYVERFTLDAATGYTTVVPNSGTVILGKGGQTLADISGAGEIDSTSNFTAKDSELNAAGTGFKSDYLKVDSLSHAGGALEFGPDGKLYVSVGDGTSFNAADARTVSVQDVNSLSGKVLRVDPVTGAGLADNPFYDGENLDATSAKVYQLGLRNPFSMSFDQTGQLFITETGWNSYEEINAGGAGANFGWPYYEGGDKGQLLKTPGYQDLPSASQFYQSVESGATKIAPAFRAFSHLSVDPGFQLQAIVGADDVIRSSAYPAALQNDLVFADFSQGEIYAVDVNNSSELKFLKKLDGLAPVHYSLGPDGFLYYVDIVSGNIGRLEIKTKEGGGGGGTQPLFTLAQDKPAETQFLDGGLTTAEIFGINGNQADYGYGPTLDGKAIVVWKGDTFDILSGYDAIRFLDNQVALTELGKSLPKTGDGTVEPPPPPPPPPPTTGVTVNDVATKNQYEVGKTALDIFAINGKSTDYGFGLTQDGQDHVVWKGSTFDILVDFEQIKFTDKTVTLTAPGSTGGDPTPPPPPAGKLYTDKPTVNQTVTGNTSKDIFVVKGKSTDYGYDFTQDNKDHVVWKGAAFDILIDFEQIKFDDVTIDLPTPPL